MACLTQLLTLPSIHADEEEFNYLIDQTKGDVIELRDEIISLYKNRCNFTNLETCVKSNYNDCNSIFPNPICKTAPDFNIANCGGRGNNCGMRWDYTVSQVRLKKEIANDDNPDVIEDVIETICLTKGLDDFFKKKYEQRKSYWEDKMGLRTPQMYVGAQNGAFRIYPARPLQNENCSKYDPRLRPWYVGGSSGAKVVILMLDISKFMCPLGEIDCQQLDLGKKAAITVIKTLTFADKVALILFNDIATTFQSNGWNLFEANETSKKLLVQQIDNINYTTLREGTNFLAAFEEVFKLLNDSFKHETVVCPIAILFLTTGKMTKPDNAPYNDTANNVLSLVRSNISDLEGKGYSTLLFTYSISEDDEEVHMFPKEIACSTAEYGVWSKIDDTKKMFDSLTSYYRLFAVALAQANKTSVSWSLLYESYTGNINVTTASLPVYDPSTNPPIFKAVVGIDLSLAALSMALGVPVGSPEILAKIKSLIDPDCTRTFDLSTCELEFFRGSEAFCTNACNETDFQNMAQKKCLNISGSSYTTLDLWNNMNAPENFSERACCDSGQTTAALAGQCSAFAALPIPTPTPGRQVNIGAVVGGTIGGLVGLLLFLFVCWKLYNNYWHNPWINYPWPEPPSSHGSVPPFSPQASMTSD